MTACATSTGPARNSLETTITPPAGNQVVGAPTLSVTVSGLGTASAVYAQLVDNKSGLVLSNIVTPVPVTLDGKTHTVTIDMEDIAYTMEPGDTLTLRRMNPYTNFRDSDNLMSLNTFSAGPRAGKPYPLHNWACQYEAMPIQGA